MMWFSTRGGIRKKGWDYILMIDANLGFFSFRFSCFEQRAEFRIREIYNRLFLTIQEYLGVKNSTLLYSNHDFFLFRQFFFFIY